MGRKLFKYSKGYPSANILNACDKKKGKVEVNLSITYTYA